jgi:hypothetical protein
LCVGPKYSVLDAKHISGMYLMTGHPLRIRGSV